MTHLVLLAAGMGKRIGDLTGDAPKVMLRLPTGRSLLAENLRSAMASGVVGRATVITGHLATMVEDEVHAHEHARLTTTRHNPAYASAGPIRSLWEARDLIGSVDVLIANGDTFYRPAAFEALGRQTAPVDGVLLAYSRSQMDADDVKVQLTADGSIAAVGKSLVPKDATAISAGLLLARGEAGRRRLSSVLEAFMADGRAIARGAIWHHLVDELAREPPGVRGVEIDPSWWREVDTRADYEALCATLL